MYPNADPTQVIGLTWAGDGNDVHAYPAIVSGHTATLDIYHFSGGGVGSGLTGKPSVCSAEADMESLIAFDWGEYFKGTTNVVPLFTNDLKTCYHDFVAPTLTAQAKARIDDNPGAAYAADNAYDFWFENVAKLDINEGRPTVSPELHDSAPVAAAFLLNWFDSWNLKCIAEPESPPQPAVQDAILAITLPHAEAPRWDLLATNPNLNDSALLHDLCVQVVIGPSRGYGGNQPGDKSAVHVPVGYTLGVGPVRNDLEIEVVLTLDGAPQPFSDAILQSAEDSVDLTWPQGVDPIKIDVVATLINPAVPAAPTIISASDQIVKSQCQHGDGVPPLGYRANVLAVAIAQASPPEGTCATPGPFKVIVPNVGGALWKFGLIPCTNATAEAKYIAGGGNVVDATWTISGPGALDGPQPAWAIGVLARGVGTIVVTATSGGFTASATIGVIANPDPLPGPSPVC